MCPPESNEFYTLMKPLLNNDIDLRGKTCIIVNVNIHDPEAETIFKNLTKLNKAYKDCGLKIFSFPCFQFGGKGSREDIVKFVKHHNFDVGQIMDEILVNGPDALKLFKYLKTAIPNGRGVLIPANFTHFIVDSRGRPFARCGKKEYRDIEHIISQMM